MSILLDPNFYNIYCGSLNTYGITFPSSDSAPLTVCSRVDEAVTLSGPFASPLSSELKLSRVGNQVALSLLGGIGDTSILAPIELSYSLPEKYRPPYDISTFVKCTTGSSLTFGYCLISALDGSIKIYSSIGGASFAPTGTGGVAPFAVSYSL